MPQNKVRPVESSPEEDKYWGERALEARKEGYASREEVMLLIEGRLKPRRGSGKSHISYIAIDFDAPLPEMQQYSE